MKETSKKDTVSGSLLQAYQCYYTYMKTIDSIESDREYVINCMTMKKLELQYRWSFMANLAYYMRNEDIQPENIPILLDSYIARLPSNPWQCFIPELHTVSTSIKTSKFLHNYKEIIDDAYISSKSPVSDQVMRVNQNKQIRYILENALDVFIKCYPIREMPSWTDAEYSAVRFFIKEYYRIDQFTNSLDFIEKLPENDRFYDILRQLYKSSRFFDQELLKASRKMKETQKKQNKKSTSVEKK